MILQAFASNKSVVVVVVVVIVVLVLVRVYTAAAVEGFFFSVKISHGSYSKHFLTI